MRISAASLVMVLACSLAHGGDYKVRDRVHLSGCDKQGLAAPKLTLWSEPGFVAGDGDVNLDKNYWVAKVSGGVAGNKARQCAGEPVLIREVRRVGKHDWVRVEVIGHEIAGWIDDSFIGKPFDTSTCAATFKGNAIALEKCKGH